MAYGDLKYVVLDEADTMFDKGFGVEVRKFLNPLQNRSRQPEGEPFQIVLVTATITKAMQLLLDDEFPGVRHIHTSTLHKKVTNARHDFLRLTGKKKQAGISYTGFGAKPYERQENYGVLQHSGFMLSC